MPARRRNPSAAAAAAFPLLAPQLLWSGVAARHAEMMLAAVEVIGRRTHRMALAGPAPNARDRREFTRMGAEKVAAAQESTLAMQRHLAVLPWQVGMRCWQDAVALSAAALRVGSSRTPAEAAARAGRLTQAANVATRRAASLSTASARMAAGALEPIAQRATANARRLRRG